MQIIPLATTRVLCLLILLSLVACESLGMPSDYENYNQSPTAPTVEWKGDLFVDVTIVKPVEATQRRLVFEFFDNEKMDGHLVMVFAVPIHVANWNGNTVASYDFIDLTTGRYYLRAYFDENSNGIFDAGETSGVYSVRGEPSPIMLETGKRQAISLSVE